MPENKGKKHNRLETKAEATVKVLYEKDWGTYKIRFESHKQGMELQASIYPVRNGDIIREKDIFDFFEKAEVKGDIDRQNMKMFVANACLGKEQEHVVLMRGKEPQKGKDEWLEFLKKPTTDKVEYVKEKGKSADYYNLNLFENVFQGDLIAKSCPPENGVPGESITGDPLPAQKGLPFPSPPRAGAGVRMETVENSLKFYAEMDGRIVFENNAISVTDQYKVQGDVGYNTGNIDFVGYVEVSGEVINDFNLRAKKGAKIHGNIGATCKIESDGDITMEGMRTKRRGSIYCGGNLSAKYLDGVIVDCRKNIIVKKEIVDCKINCGGYIEVKKGTVKGGSTHALGGIEAEILGSDADVKTVVVVGIDLDIEEKIKEIEKELNPINRQIEKIGNKLDPIMKNPRMLASLTPNEKNIVRELAQKFNELIPQQKELKEKLDAIRKDVDARANQIVNVLKTLETGVEITFGHTEKHLITSKKTQQASIIRSSRDGSLRFAPLHPVTDKAKDIEKEIIRLEEEEKKRKEAEEKKEV